MSIAYFILKCRKCNWFRKSNGLSSELSDLSEIKTCQKCGGRKFKCPKCNTTIKLMRFNEPDKKEEK